MPTRLHGVPSHKTLIFTVSAVRTLNLTRIRNNIFREKLGIQSLLIELEMKWLGSVKTMDIIQTLIHQNLTLKKKKTICGIKQKKMVQPGIRRHKKRAKSWQEIQKERQVRRQK